MPSIGSSEMLAFGVVVSEDLWAWDGLLQNRSVLLFFDRVFAKNAGKRKLDTLMNRRYGMCWRVRSVQEIVSPGID